MVPMHVPEDTVASLVTILRCRRDSFPQTYLGLPLSNTKLRVSTFAPPTKLISSWQDGKLPY